MILFVVVLVGLILVALILQILTKMKIVGGNELGIVSGKGSDKGFKALSGGRIFIIPFLNRFAKLDLTPHTIEVPVESAIASGVVPLNVKATVSFGIASNESGRMRAVTRILSLARDSKRLMKVASDIIEGHLRDSIASITPEQVMKDKDTLVARMINVCKSDLENIGLEITTMNIADVDDHRLEGVDEPDLYIALLKRVQSANAQTKARVAQAEAKAAAVEQEETRRAEVQVRSLENEYERLVAETRVKVAEEQQRRIVGVKQAEQNGQAQVAGLKAEIESEKQRVEMLQSKFKAEITTPAEAEKERTVYDAKAQAARLREKAEAEIEQMAKTLKIIEEGGTTGNQTYLIENFERLIKPFAETLSYFPVHRLSVITGAEGRHEPISAIHPNAIEKSKNDLIAGAIAETVLQATARSRRPGSDEAAESSEDAQSQKESVGRDEVKAQNAQKASRGAGPGRSAS